MTKRARCVNLDWLEVCALEPINEPRDPDYYRSRGIVVHERDYGTKVWGEMFTLLDDDHLGWIEVRRAPKSDIIAQNITHLRLTNRACYFPNAADLMQEFLDTHGYEFHHIVRVDVCLDLERFDYGDKPRDFLRRYMQEKYSKINQGTIASHGDDRWEGRIWNSVSWGSPTSDVGTKFYCKTLELYDPITKRYGKPYIRQSWQAYGLVDDAATVTKTDDNGKQYTPEIWRIEFSIRSSVRRWFLIRLDGDDSKKQSIRNTLDMYNTPEKLTIMFAALQRHYFRFKHLIKRYNFYSEGHTDGYAIRKDRCPDKLLFNWKDSAITYKVEKQYVATSEKPDTSLAHLLNRLKQYRDRTHDTKVKSACTVIIDAITYQLQHHDRTNPSTRAERDALQLVMKWKSAGSITDVSELIREAKELMQIRAEILPFDCR